MKVVVLCGGPSSEYDVSLSTTEGIINNIDPKYEMKILLMGKNYKAVLFDPKEDRKDFPFPKKELSDELSNISKDSVVLIAMHGEFGEDGVVQSLLDSLDLRYTGSKAAASVLCMDKYASYQALMGKVNIEIPEIYSIEKLLSASYSIFEYPLIIKPNALGSSVGVKIAEDEKELKTIIGELKGGFSGIDFIFQEYIGDAVEISCGCLEKRNGEFIQLPPVEIQPQVNKFYDYKSKYEEGGSIHHIPPVSIDKTLQDKVSNLACEIHKILGCSTYSRSDFLVKDGVIYYLETNSLPGMTATSLIPEEAKQIGINYRGFLNFIIENA